jgi:CYTH domain-containing protein
LVDGREAKPWRKGSVILRIEQHYNVATFLETREDALWLDGKKFTALTQNEVELLAKTTAWTTRLRKSNETYVLTYKSRISDDTAYELEWVVEEKNALALLDSGPFPSIEKTRYVLPGSDGLVWEVDEFEGGLAGIVLAEVELASSQVDVILPPWVGQEITGLASWSNHALAETLALRTA